MLLWEGLQYYKAYKYEREYVPEKQRRPKRPVIGAYENALTNKNFQFMTALGIINMLSKFLIKRYFGFSGCSYCEGSFVNWWTNFIMTGLFAIIRISVIIGIIIYLIIAILDIVKRYIAVFQARGPHFDYESLLSVIVYWCFQIFYVLIAFILVSYILFKTI